MRLFAALELPANIMLFLERLLSALRPEAQIKWSPLDNLHITTKFIGEWPDEKLETLHSALAPLMARESFEVELRNLGWFPNDRAPRVLWAGVHGGPALQQLAMDTDERLAQLGIAREDRPFSPHLTLARIRNPAPLQRLRETVEESRTVTIGTFMVSGFCLFRSDPGSNASIYRKLRDYPFQTTIAASQQTT